MAIKVEELKRWLETLDEKTLVWVDGNNLKNSGLGYEASLEVGEKNGYQVRDRL